MTDKMHENEWRTMVACDDYDADGGGIRGAYSEVMNGRLFVFIFMTNRWWLVTSFARLLRNRDIGPANLF